MKDSCSLHEKDTTQLSCHHVIVGNFCVDLCQVVHVLRVVILQARS